MLCPPCGNHSKMLSAGGEMNSSKSCFTFDLPLTGMFSLRYISSTARLQLSPSRAPQRRNDYGSCTTYKSERLQTVDIYNVNKTLSPKKNEHFETCVVI